MQVTPAGVDSQVSIRSAAAATRYRYRIDLPAGGSLHQLADDSISVRRNGRRVGMITTPTAWDADHRAIPVTSSLTGRVLTLDVGVDGRDVRFPATLDPNYVDILQYSWYTGGRNSAGEPNPRYWNFITNAPAAMSGLFGNYGGGAYGQTQGLYAGTKGNQATYAGYNAYWHFTAPGTTSVLQAEWTRLSQIYTYAVGPPPCLDYGLTTSSGTWGTLGRECGQFTPAYRLSCVDCNPDDGFDYNPAITGAQFGAYVPTNTFSNISDYLGESTLYLADADDPSVSLTSQPASGWSENPTGTIAANASDPGLGVQSMTIGADTTSNSNCLSAGPCPGSMSASASIATLNVPDGANTVNVTARDASYFSARNVAAQHIRTVPTTIKRDRDKPVITPSGTLNAARNGFVGPNQDYTLSVTATDGSLSPLSAQRSGVTSLSATLDGQPMTGGSTGTVPCTRPEGSCTLSINATVTGAQLATLDPGEHTVEIKALDAVGHPQTDSFTVNLDDAEPDIDLDGSLADYEGETLAEDSYRLISQALDTDADRYGSGLRDIVVRLDGQPVSTTAEQCLADSSCEQARGWNWDTTAATTGPHTITITAADNVNNQTVETVEVDLQRVPDQPGQTSSTVSRTVLGASTGDQAGSAATALGDVNGDHLADYLVGAPGVTSNGRAAAGAAYIVLGDANGGTTDLATSTATRRILGPGANSYCGTAVAAAGDVNGDGLGDLLVGCPGTNPLIGSLTAAGKVYVIFGRTDPQDIDLANIGTAGFAVTGPTDTLQVSLPALKSRATVFGERLQSTTLDADSVTQDVNGDGLGDIVIGDSATKRDSLDDAGAAFVIYGKADSTTVDASALGANGFTIRGSRASGLAGYSSTIAGDLDGDGLADIIVGEPGATAATGGQAHVILGSDDGSSVDLAAPATRAVTLTSGQASDRFGVNVAALGDTDRDGREDFAIGTSAGAYVVRTLPTVNRQISADDGYMVTGPVNAPNVLNTAVPGAPIASAGDVNADGRADLAIGFPDAAGARGYSVFSPERTRTVNVAALPGQRGVGLTGGTQGDRSGATIGANADQTDDAGVTEPSQVLLGAPDASPSLRIRAGSAYLLAAQPASPPTALRALAASQRAPACGYTDRTHPYDFAVGPTVKYGYRAEILANGRANYTGLNAVLPKCRLSVAGKRDEVPRGFRKIAQNRASTPFRGASAARDIVDSKGRAFGQLRQTLKTVGSKRAVKDWQVIINGAVVNTLTPKQTKFSVQGYACYVGATSAEKRTDFVMVALRPLPGQPGPGIRGFIDRAAVGYVTNRALSRADTRCGTSRGLKPSPKASLQRSGVATEKYQGASSARTECPTNYAQAGCGASFETYEPSSYPGTITLALSTTGIGGVTPSEGGGGIAMAILRNDDAYRTLDTIGYNDPNVPCARQPTVRWAFIKGNPDSAKRTIYAWLPVKIGNVATQGVRICPADSRQP